MTDKKEVWPVVEDFRKEYFGEDSQEIPIDVFTLCEITLRLDVIPFEGLLSEYGIDAGIIPDFSGIYVDSVAYKLWESGPVWKQNGLRFSVADELGHFVLHKEIAATLNLGHSKNLEYGQMMTNMPSSNAQTNLPEGFWCPSSD